MGPKETAKEVAEAVNNKLKTIKIDARTVALFCVLSFGYGATQHHVNIKVESAAVAAENPGGAEGKA